MSIIVAACNEEGYIGDCLGSLLKQNDTGGAVEIIVSANGCTDRTVEIVQNTEEQITARGWHLVLLDSAEPGKLNALRRAEAAAVGDILIYLDADVTCDPDLLGQLYRALSGQEAIYATGRLQVSRAKSWITRQYADLWLRLPFIKGGAVGAGLFAVNRAGRMRWGAFPDIISDDTFVRLQFAPSERREVSAAYYWPMVEGFRNLVRVRRRQNAGVSEVYSRYPNLQENEGKSSIGVKDLIGLLVAAPVGFVVYGLVHVAVRLQRAGSDWTRGR